MPRVFGHRTDQHAQHVIVVRIQFTRRRGHGDELAGRIGADLTEERFARRDGAFFEVQIPLRRAGNADLVLGIPVKIDRLMPHQLVPDDEAVDAADGNQLVRKVVPARIDGHRPDLAPCGRAQQRNFRQDQTWIRCHHQRRLVPIEQLIRPWVRGQPVEQRVSALPADHRRRNHRGDQPLEGNPSNRLLRCRLGPADLHGLGDAGVDVRRLHQREQAPFEAGGPVRRQRLEADAGLFELADEGRIFDERRNDHHHGCRGRLEQPVHQTGSQHVARRTPVRDREEHDGSGGCHA